MKLDIVVDVNARAAVKTAALFTRLADSGTFTEDVSDCLRTLSTELGSGAYRAHYEQREKEIRAVYVPRVTG